MSVMCSGIRGMCSCRGLVSPPRLGPAHAGGGDPLLPRPADLHLKSDATAALDAVSAPTPGGCPYGVFGSGQRALPRRTPGLAGSRRRRK